ncbi:MAG: glycosyltransferase, partial [Methyloceanibacter sp.]
MRNVMVAVVVALATALHASVWLLMHEQVSPPNANGVLASISFSPINPKHDGETDKTSEAQIKSDLAAVAPYTRSVRTYSVGNGLDRVPQLASEVGLRVTLGVWINEWEDQNEKELESAIALAKQYRNIDSIIVGNETVFRAQAEHRDDPDYKANDTVRDLIAKIQRVKREVRVPVTTAEVPNVWLEYPQLASAVDYLAVHILPYWEGIPGSRAVDHALNGYERLRQAYPGKRIVIAEFGWPSAGLNRKDAVPSPLTQADVVRDFVTRADAMGIDYSIVEAFDQPWKTNEGSVGPYWGIFNADRHAKFSFAGAVEEPNFLLKVIAALGIGLLLSIPIFGIPRATAAQAGVLALTASAIGAWSANVVDYWVTHYFVLGSQLALFVGAGLLVPLILIMKRRIEELAAILFGAKGRRLLTQGGGMPEHVPLVSIHIPACREPPEMLRQTLDAVAALNWPNFECVVVINNTPDSAMCGPIEDHCRLLGPRFKFLRADRLQGFKAGALRLALEHTAPEAEIIGVLDADYAVHPDWLKDLVPAFADPAVGLVQAPQDHRDASRTVTQAVMNREYAGFFDIGMVERNEVNAIVVHGTMCLIRLEALLAAGNWSSDTIVEDTDLGLSLLERGW